MGVAAVLSVTAGLTYWPLLDTTALDTDNLQTLTSTLVSNPFTLFLEKSHVASPIYRPLPYLTVWVQYRMTGMAAIPFFAVNAVLGLVCSLAVYALARRLAAPVLVAGATALLLLLDPRIISALYWIGARTQTMALLFSMGALILAYRGMGGRWKAARYLALVGLLAGAALSKEYGLATSLAS